MGLLRRSHRQTAGWKRAIAVGVSASVLYSAIVFAYSVHPATNVSISGSAWQGFALSTLLAFGSVGVPVVLWLRYDVRSPFAFMAFVLLFWHVLVYVPPFGSGRGDSPGFLFVLVWVPFYLGAYGLLAAGEWWLRGRASSQSPQRT